MNAYQHFALGWENGTWGFEMAENWPLAMYVTG